MKPTFEQWNKSRNEKWQNEVMKLFKKAYPDKPHRYLGPLGRQKQQLAAAAATERFAVADRKKKLAAESKRELAAELRRQKAQTRKPVARRTSQRAKEERTYQKLAKEYLAAFGNEICQACKPLWKVMHGTLPPDWMPARASQVHHSHGRRGKLLLHRPFFIPVCGDCHHIITFTSPAAAREAGVLCQEGRYNDQSAVE